MNKKKIIHTDLPYHCYFLTANTKYRKEWLKDFDLAHEVLDAIYQYREEYEFKLLAFVIMPDHFHLMLVPTGERSASEIMKEIKRTSSIKINRRSGRKGAFWQEGYYEDILDGEKMVKGKIEYIHNNPVKAGLSMTQADYLFSSANERWKKDWDYL